MDGAGSLQSPTMSKAAFFRNRGAVTHNDHPSQASPSQSPTYPSSTTSSFSKPSALPRLQASFASAMRGYTPPLATGRRTPTASSPVVSHGHGYGYGHGYDSSASVRSNSRTGGPVGYQAHSTAPPASTMPFSPLSPTSPSSGLPASFARSPGPEPAWGAKGHRSQHASTDFDNMVAEVGLNRLTLSPTSDFDLDHDSSGAATATQSRDMFIQMDSPQFARSGDFDLEGDSEFARAFSPPSFGRYSLPDHDAPVSAVSPVVGDGDHFSPLPNMISRRPRSPSRHNDPRIGPQALASPPPHERWAPRTEESHDSGLSGSSAATGVTDSSAFPPYLSRSTSTVVTSMTAVTSPVMGSDEMLMALMASQAAVDCDSLPVGAWEEVETWKKELSLLATRVDALQARHQREVKILTAARTLQKLNQANKRMSKQTMESLEQSEKRVEKAEKELLVLRNREASLRRRLMEHWAGVMAWEVRRLERTASDAQSRLEMHVRAADSDRQSLIERLAAIDTGDPMPTKMLDNGDHNREQELYARVAELENQLLDERNHKSELESQNDERSSQIRRLESTRELNAGRIAELEEIVLELGRRERALEDGAKGHDEKLLVLEQEKADWLRERESHATERSMWEQQHSQASQYAAEREQLIAERDTLISEKAIFESRIREYDERGAAWAADRERLNAEREQLAAEREQLQQAHAALENRHTEDRSIWHEEREQLVAERELLAAPSATWQRERETTMAKHDRMATDLEALAVEHDGLKEESRQMQVAHETALGQREQLLAQLRDENAQLKVSADRATAMSRATTERLGTTLTAILGRTVGDAAIVPALEEVRAMLDNRDMELMDIQDRHNEEIHQLTADRDGWKARSDESALSSRSTQEQMTELIKKIRMQNEQIASLKSQVQLAGNASDGALEAKLQQLWVALPSPTSRAESGLNDPKIVSPSKSLDFSALQRAYKGSTDKYTNSDDLVARVRDLIDDGRIMLERMQRTEQEKEQHKANAMRAAQLVRDSQSSLEKYKEQVAELEARLDRMPNDHGGPEVSELEREIVVLHREIDQAHGENQRLHHDVQESRSTIDMFSARALRMADEHEREKNQLQVRLQREIDNLKAELDLSRQGVEEERTRAQQQSAQMMGEMMDLQDEIAKLRAARR